MNKNHDYQIQQMLLAFDSSGCSLITIEHIVSIASQLRSSIEAIYIEDNNLLTAAELPFTREVSLHTAQTRKLSSQQISRHYQNLAEQIRTMLEAQSRLANIQATFRIARGTRMQTVLQEALHAQLLFLPAVSRALRASRQKYVAAIIDQNNLMPLRLAKLLAQKLDMGILVICEDRIQLPEDLQQQTNQDSDNMQLLHMTTRDPRLFIRQLKPYAIDALVMPESHIFFSQPENIQYITDNLKCDILVSRNSQTNTRDKQIP